MKRLNAKSIRFKIYSNQTAGTGLQPVPHKQVNEICFFNGMNRITFETYR
jgi:hypothetical protein